VFFVAMECPSCGAPLPPEAKMRTVVCRFCGASVMHDRWMARRRDYALALESEQRAALGLQDGRVDVGGRTYVVAQKIATGESTDVCLAERIGGARERVVLRILRDGSDAGRFERSCVTLERLGKREELARRVPRLRHRGKVTSSGSPVTAAVLGYEAGFFQTLWDVREAHGPGFDPAHSVWIWRRILGILGAVHGAGFLHRAVLPQHLLVHARDHGVLLVGWGAAAEGEAPIDGVVEPFQSLYPESSLSGSPFTAHHDVAMSARVIGWLLRENDSWHPGPATPALLRDLILAVGSGHDGMDALAPKAIDAELKRRAATAFGAPGYRRLHMAGWK
jgi:hypothetical protein